MNKALLAIIGVLVVGTIAAFALSPYFTESTIDEALPTGAITQPKTDGAMMEEAMMDDAKMEEEAMMDDAKMEEEAMMDDAKMEEEAMMDDAKMEEEAMMDDAMEDVTPVVYSGNFVGVGDGIHDAQGDAFTVPIEDGSNVLRLENFKATNGPDLFVYLSTDKDASEFVNLGELKASSGNQNYEIPDEVDLTQYNNVLIWCKAFGVLFGSAELLPQ
ncbi:MAG: DM13 domain-containing protein [Nitrosopumilus sp.]|nr:DM13 domain-containing protein [Nitrosopumilus sp.]